MLQKTKKKLKIFESPKIEGDFSELRDIFSDIIKFAIKASNDFKKPVAFYFDNFMVFAKDGDAKVFEQKPGELLKHTQKNLIEFFKTGRSLRTIGTYNPILKKYVCCDRYKNPNNYHSPLIVTCYCGTEFETNDRRKIWCSRKCRDDYRNASTGKGKPKGLPPRLCPFCGEEYEPKQRRSMSCGKAKCRTRLSRRNERRKKVEVSYV
jgi:hypothetical protein